MDLKAFVPALAQHAGVRDANLLEQDVRLHLLLAEIMADTELRESLAFKGGTCLIKCIFGYWRFSQDLDFTWRDQTRWADLRRQAAERAIRPARRELAEAIYRHGASLGMIPFEEPRHGQSGQIVTLQLQYEETSGLTGYVRIQVAFLDPLLFKTKEREAKSLLSDGPPEELEFLDAELTHRYATPVKCWTYDPREILVEKCRAILTREASKAKDVLDLYLLDRHLGLHVQDYREAVESKTMFSLERRERYLDQLRGSSERFRAIAEEDIGPLLLMEVDREDYAIFRRDLLTLLEELGSQLLDSIGNKQRA